MGFVLGETCGTKPCVFPFKEAAANDERYVCCGCGLDRFDVFFLATVELWLQAALAVFVYAQF